MKINLKKLALSLLFVGAGVSSLPTQAMFGNKSLMKWSFVAGSVAVAVTWVKNNDDTYQRESFFEHCRTGNIEALRASANRIHVDYFPKYVCHNNCEALQIALENGHLEVAQFLLRHQGVDLAQNDYKAVLHALKTNNKQMVKLFFEYLSEINKFDDMAIVVDRAMDLDATSKAVREEVNKHISFYRLDSNDHLYTLKIYTLKKAVFDGNVNLIKKSHAELCKLDGQKYAISDVRCNNEPLVCLAVRYNQIDSLKTLCSLGATVFPDDFRGKALITLAKQKNYGLMVDALTECAAQETLAKASGISETILGQDNAHNIIDFLETGAIIQETTIQEKLKNGAASTAHGAVYVSKGALYIGNEMLKGFFAMNND